MRRLLLLAVIVLAGLWTGSAIAAPAYYWVSNAVPSTPFGSGDDACQASPWIPMSSDYAKGNKGINIEPGDQAYDGGDGACEGRRIYIPGPYTSYVGLADIKRWPCGSGPMPDAASNPICFPPPPSDPCAAVANFDEGLPHQWRWDGSAAGMEQGCFEMADGSACYAKPDPGGRLGCGSNGPGQPGWCNNSNGVTYTGKSCSLAGGAKPPAPNNVCDPGTTLKDGQCVQNPPLPQPPPPGKCIGQVNGIDTPVDCTNTAGNTNSQSTSPTGDVTRSTTSTNCQADGTCTTTQTDTTTHSDGSTTTTVTNTTVNQTQGTGSSTSSKCDANADGTSKGPCVNSSTNGTADGACKAAPNAAGCGNGTGSANFGDCPGGPALCTGDAIECAIAAEEHKLRCAEQKRFDDLRGTPQDTLGEAVLAGQDPAFQGGAFKAGQGGSTVDVGSSALDQTGFLGGGQCFTDKTLTFAGRTLVLPFSKFCDPMSVLPPIVLVVAGLISLGIVFGAVKGA